MDFGQIKLELRQLLFEDFKSLRSSGKQKQRFLSKFSKIIVLAEDKDLQRAIYPSPSDYF